MKPSPHYGKVDSIVRFFEKAVLALLLTTLLIVIVVGGFLFSRMNRLYVFEKEISESIKENIEPVIPQMPVISYPATMGEGVRIRIDSGYKGSSIVHDSDILMLLNELYALQLSDIDINGKRITPYSYVRCTGPTIIINGDPIQISPTLIDVLGDPDYIISGMGIITDYFRNRGIEISYLALELIEISAGG